MSKFKAAVLVLTTSVLFTAGVQAECKKTVKGENLTLTCTGTNKIACTKGKITVNGSSIGVSCPVAKLTIKASKGKTISAKGLLARKEVSVDGSNAEEPLTINLSKLKVKPAWGSSFRGVSIKGGNGADTIVGSEFDDNINGGPGDDIIDAGAGDDSVYGDLGDDDIDGGEGDDSLFGDDGADDIDGGDGDDSLYGGDGEDYFFGGDGSDNFNYNEGDTPPDMGDGDIENPDNSGDGIDEEDPGDIDDPDSEEPQPGDDLPPEGDFF